MQKIKYVYLSLVFLIIAVMGLGLVAPLHLKENCDRDTADVSISTIKELSTVKEKVQEIESILKRKVSFRNTLIQWNSLLRYRLFNTTIDTDQAVVGKEGWLFYSSKSDKIYDSYTRDNAYTQDELQEALQVIQERTKTLADKGIQYCHAIWPNKSTIYPEYMPQRYSRQQKPRDSRMTQFFDGSKGSNLPVVDVRATLHDLKESHLLYLEHDTHWNDYGAYYAYVALMNQLNIEPYPITDFEVSWTTRTKGDLLNLIGLCNANSIQEMNPVLKYKGNKIVKMIERKGPKGPLFRCTNTEKKKLLMFRDSFGTALRSFVSLHFETAYYPWKRYNQTIVDNLQPDVVIVAKIERYL